MEDKTGRFGFGEMLKRDELLMIENSKILLPPVELGISFGEKVFPRIFSSISSFSSLMAGVLKRIESGSEVNSLNPSSSTQPCYKSDWV